jgi:hypothetical protein
MERTNTFTDWHNWHYSNEYIIESSLQTQCNFHENSNDILHINKRNNPKAHTEAKNTMISQSNS